jgi:hypothetical protein
MALIAGPCSSGVQDAEPLSKKPALGPSCRCPLGMALFIGSLRSHFSCSSSDLKRWCWGDRSHTLLALIVRRPTTHLVTPPYLPLVAPVPQGTPMLEVWEASSTNGTLQGAISTEVDGASLRPGDGSRGLLQDWVMHGAGIGAPRNVASGDVTLAPGSLGAIGAGGIRAATSKIEGRTLSLELWARWLAFLAALACRADQRY